MPNQRTVDYWNKRGATYSSSWVSQAKRRLSGLETDLIRGVVRASLERLLGQTIKTLDIGVGLGRISQPILDYRVEHRGIDVSSTMVDYCQKKFAGNPKVKEFRVHDILRPLPPEWGKFDVITAIRVLSYSPQWRKELRNIYQALNPGGVLVFTFPNRYSSALLPKFLLRKETPSYDTTLGELKRTLEEVGFSECQIVGYSRLLDVFYDWCNSSVFVNILFGIEKIFGRVLGPTLFARLFYCVCTK